MDNQGQSPTSLQVFVENKIIFQSNGKWLYPLFDLEKFLLHHPIDMSDAVLHDKVIGKAAVFLICRLGPGYVHGTLMSDLAINLLTTFKLSYSFDTRVKRIDCITEEILADIDDPDIAYKILRERAK